MSVFYCDYHQRLEDSDYSGYNSPEESGNRGEICDDALWDIQYEESLSDEALDILDKVSYT